MDPLDDIDHGSFFSKSPTCRGFVLFVRGLPRGKSGWSRAIRVRARAQSLKYRRHFGVAPWRWCGAVHGLSAGTIKSEISLSPTIRPELIAVLFFAAPLRLANAGVPQMQVRITGRNRALRIEHRHIQRISRECEMRWTRLRCPEDFVDDEAFAAYSV